LDRAPLDKDGAVRQINQLKMIDCLKCLDAPAVAFG
jgi:hypothetical protein